MREIPEFTKKKYRLPLTASKRKSGRQQLDQSRRHQNM